MTNREKVLKQINEYTNVELAKLFAYQCKTCEYCPFYEEDLCPDVDETCFDVILKRLEGK